MNSAAAPHGFQARVIKRQTPPSEKAQSAQAAASSPPQDATIISNAHAEAKQIIAAAQADAKAFIEQAQMQQTEAYTAFVQATHLEMSKELIAFRMALQNEIGQTRVTLARIIRSSCEKIIGVMNPPDKLLDRIIDQGVRTYAKGGKVILRVSPADKEAALAVATRFSAAKSDIVFHVVDEETMPEGQCQIENADTVIHLGLKPQLDLLEALLARTDESDQQKAAAV